ncbi:MAG: hypothetical protein ACREBG_20820, partial [Pyrinomonadaceae bacterium]
QSQRISIMSLFRIGNERAANYTGARICKKTDSSYFDRKSELDLEMQPATSDPLLLVKSAGICRYSSIWHEC